MITRRVCTWLLAVVICWTSSMMALVPHTVLSPHVSDGMISSPHLGRHISLFTAYDTANTLLDDAVGSLGIFQTFNASDLAKSLDLFSQESGDGVYTPQAFVDMPNWKGARIYFKTESLVRAQRAVLSYKDVFSLSPVSSYVDANSVQYKLLEGGSLCFGATLPLVYMQASNTYVIDRDLSDTPFARADDAIDAKLEKLRAELFKKAGLKGNIWDQMGTSDVEVYVGVVSHLDYFMRLRTLDMGFLVGALLPVGFQRDHELTASLPLGLHTPAFFTSAFCNLGLKDYLSLGLNMGLVAARESRYEQRVSVYNEPAALSPLVFNMMVKPGITTWFNPHIQVKNIANNVHFIANYAWATHWPDVFTDDRPNPVVKSVFGRPVDEENGVMRNTRDQAIKRAFEASAWKTRHLGFALTYEPFQMRKDVRFDPLLTVGCQFARGGANAPKMHHVFVGLSVLF